MKEQGDSLFNKLSTDDTIHWPTWEKYSDQYKQQEIITIKNNKRKSSDRRRLDVGTGFMLDSLAFAMAWFLCARYRFGSLRNRDF